MSIPKEYYELIEETRDEVVADDISECASMYMDTLRMERAEPEQPVYELVKDYVPTDDATAVAIRAKAREDIHVTAECIQELPDEYAGEKGFIMLARMNDGRELAYMLEIMQDM